MCDGEAEGDARYEATRSHTYRSGDYEITETEHYDIYRAGFISFEKIPADASSKMPDDHMDSIEPYDYQELKPFSTAYLPGFLADKFDVTVEQCRQRADQRCAGTLSATLRDTVTGYHTCTLIHESVSLKRGKVHYALMPVWMLNTKWKGKDFLFAMNGQTGKLVGDLPVSWGRFWGLFAAKSPLCRCWARCWRSSWYCEKEGGADMKKTCSIFVLILLLALSLCTPALAATEYGVIYDETDELGSATLTMQGEQTLPELSETLGL